MVQEVIYLRKFLENLGFPQKEPTPVLADNETRITWAEGAVGGSERAKQSTSEFTSCTTLSRQSTSSSTRSGVSLMVQIFSLSQPRGRTHTSTYAADSWVTKPKH